MHNHDAVFWSVVICVVGAAAVLGWLLYVVARNAGRSKNKN
jgi:hypothetical protein